jgi:hypothetical protein
MQVSKGKETSASGQFGCNNRRNFLKMATFAAAAIPSFQYAHGKNRTPTTGASNGISLNYDDSSFFVSHTAEEMNAATVDAWPDQFAGTQVKQLLFCPSAQRSDVPSKIRQTVWDGYDPDGGFNQPFLAAVPDRPFPEWPGGPNERQHMLNWIHNVWLLHTKNIDPVQHWLDRTRTHQISPWLTFRMNDVHYVDNPDHPIHSRFWREHPEYRRDLADKYNGQALDYGRVEVRSYSLEYIRELTSRYDCDGIELDWMRNPYHFKPGQENEGLAIITDFTAQVRDLLRKREKELGHPVQLSARVPVRLETALGLGFDVEAWAKRNLIDRLVVMPFLMSQFDIPIERWTKLLEGHQVALDAGLMVSIANFSGGIVPAHTLETARGGAGSFLDRGADRVYLFNFFDNSPYGVGGEAYRQSDRNKGFQQIMHEIGSLETMAGKSRRHVLCNDDTMVPGQRQVSVLPREIGPGSNAKLKIPTGGLPQKGQIVQVRLAVGPFQGDHQLEWKVLVNGRECQQFQFVPFPLPNRPSLAFVVPPGTLVRGFSEIEISNPGKSTSNLEWVEFAVSGPHGEWPSYPVDLIPMDS